MEHSKPFIAHAGCGGQVTRVNDRLTCLRCRVVITDPLEMQPRGTGFRPDPQPAVIQMYRMDAA